MKKMIFSLLFSFLLTATFTPTFSQVNIEISKEITTVNGKQFFIHEVANGQTLYGISKAYNVNIAEIKLVNNLSDTQLPIGYLLKIPCNDKISTIINDEQKDKNFVTKTENTNITVNQIKNDTEIAPNIHIVEKGESLYSIATKYNTNVQNLKNLNPEIDNTINIGQKIKILPDEQSALKDVNKIHIVESGQTLYSIAKKYMFSIDELKKLNPEINNNISIGQKIIVGKQKLPTEDLTSTKINDCTKPNKLSEYNIAMLIPLSMEKSRAKIFNSSDKDKNKYYEFEPFSYIEFYEGFKFALDTMVKAGMKINLKIYDLDESTDKLAKVLNSPEMKKMNLVFGPFDKKNLDTISSFCYKYKIPIVSCFLSGNINLREINPYYFNPITSVHYQTISLAKYFVKQKSDANIIIAFQDSQMEELAAQTLSKEIEKLGHHATMVNINAEGLKSVTQKFISSKENVIVSLINGDVFVSNYIRNLNDYKSKYDITLFSLPGWLKYEVLDIEFLEYLNTHFFSSSFIDYERSDVRDFAKNFQKRYKCDPGKQGFLGYDIGVYFLSALHNYGTTFMSFLDKHKVNTLSTNFEWDNIKGEGERNTFINIYKMKDFQLWNINDKAVNE